MPRACIWDYVSVMYRDPRAPLDPREWALRNRWLYAPSHLLRDIRSGRWQRTSPLGRTALAGGAAAYAAVVVGLLAFIVMMLTGTTPRARWGRLDRGEMALILGLFLLLTTGWPAAWMTWIAAGGPDRAT